MYPCTKFRLIWRTSDLGNKFANENFFEKINIKLEIKIWQCTPALNFNQFRELQFLRQTLPKKTL